MKAYFSMFVIMLFSILILFFAGNFSDNSFRSSIEEQVRCLFLPLYCTIRDVLDLPVMVTSCTGSSSSSSLSFSICNNYTRISLMI